MEFEFNHLTPHLKRVLSMVLAMILCLNLVAPAFAADDHDHEAEGTIINEDEIDFGSHNVYWGDVTGNASKVSSIAKAMAEGQRYNVAIHSSLAFESAYFTFTPEESAEYTFHTDADTVVFLYDYCNPSAPKRIGSSWDDSVTASLSAGETYLYRVRYQGDTTGSFNVFLTKEVREVSGKLERGENRIAVGEDETVYYSYTPDVSGTYYIYSTGDEDTYGYLYSADWSELSSDDDAGKGNNFQISCDLEQGTEYIIGAKFWDSSQSGIICVELADTDSNAPQISGELQKGVNQIPVGENETVYYSFTPNVSGTYYIYSTGDEDTYGYLYSADWSELSSDDDAGKGNNFQISYHLERGTEYIIGAKFWDSSKSGIICVALADSDDDLWDNNYELVDVKLGENTIDVLNYDATPYRYFVFTPESTGKYLIQLGTDNNFSVGPLNITEDGESKTKFVNTEDWSYNYNSVSYQMEADTAYGIWVDSGSDRTDTLTILQHNLDISTAVYGVWTDYSDYSATYWGSSIEPSVEVYDRIQECYLTQGTDYTVTYQNNDRPGGATILIQGFGEYTGTVERHFQIKKGSTSCSYWMPASEPLVAGESRTLTVYTDGVTVTSSDSSVVSVKKQEKEDEGQEYQYTITGLKKGEVTLTLHAEDTVYYHYEDAVIEIKVNEAGHEHDYEVTVLEPCNCGNYGEHHYKCKTCGYEYDSWDIEPTGNHTMVDVNEPANCGRYGFVGKRCSVCGYEDGERSEPVGEHQWAMEVYSEPDCWNTGYKYRHCSVCGEWDDSQYEEIPTLDHDYQEAERVEPDCKTWTYGHIIYKCTHCGDSYSDELYPEHDFEWVDVGPTCTEYGGRKYICKNCGYVDYDYDDENMEPLGHIQGDEVSREVIKPTCKDEGYTEVTYRCSRCGENYTQYTEWTEELGHSQGAEISRKVIEPTCDSRGYTEVTYRCSSCGENYTQYTEWTEELDHIQGAEISRKVIEPTCDSRGYTEVTYRCSRCGENYTDIIKWESSLGHEYVNKETVREATCTKGGLMKAVCDRCGSVKLVAIPASGHNFKFNDNGDGTHTKTCVACGKSSVEAHQMQNGICVSCGYSEHTGHVHEFTTSVIAPTCKNRGYTEYSCKSCNYSYQDNFKDATGAHNLDRVSVKNPTCTKIGTRSYYCTGCGVLMKTEPIPTIDHTWDNGKATKGPTCGADGEKIVTCTDCGATKTESIPATGQHKPGNFVVTKAATCTAAGEKTQTCTVCKAVLKKEAIPALGHTWDAGKVTKAATASAEGVKTFTCTRTGCGATRTEAITKLPKTNNTITAKNFTKTVNTKKAQSFKIGAKVLDKAKLTYKSSNKNVTVNAAGKVTIKKGFIGKATITITAAATANRNAATKKITITVNPAKAALSSAKNTASKKMTVKWKKTAGVAGYQIQYSTAKNFKKGNKTVNVKGANKTSQVIGKLAKGKTYYVRIRTYKKVSGKTYYSAWSSVKSVKIKK